MQKRVKTSANRQADQRALSYPPAHWRRRNGKRFLAEDIILEREVAIKILRFDFVNDIDFIRRFRREAQSASSLDHPNIVSIYDIGEEGDIYYIVMEYVEGMTIKGIHNRTRTASSERSAVRYGADRLGHRPCPSKPYRAPGY